jgi:hypothetical protein
MSENLPRLHYLLSENVSEPLPEWAYFFMRVGHKLAIMPNNNYRVVAGIAVPVRAFACSLVATGVVLARTASKNPSNATQLQKIRSLKPGTPVYVRTDDNKKLRGFIDEVKEIQGQERVVIRTGKGETRYFSLEQFASRITVSNRTFSLPVYPKSGYPIEPPSKFLQCCLGKELAQKHILESSFETLLVGKKSVIKYEVSDTFLSCKRADKLAGVTGCLQEILRIRQFSGANKSYRTQCISSVNVTPEKAIGKQTPPIVIFDGAVAYIKLGHKWRSAIQIVLLDRTERQFADATELLNQNYTYRLANTPKLPIKIPNGIEMMVYKEGI